MNRGDVYWFNFKEPDKPRPALIITRESAISYLFECGNRYSYNNQA
jgi:mRNA-degrading endonuclease toxin of MazEF toxin-antitoxin module